MTEFNGFQEKYQDAIDDSIAEQERAERAKRAERAMPIATITDTYSRDHFGDDRQPEILGTIDCARFINENVEFDDDVASAFDAFESLPPFKDVDRIECIRAFMLARGMSEATQFCTVNMENDLDNEFIVTVFATDDCSDWIWAEEGECIVVFQDGYCTSADPRFVTEFPDHEPIIPLTYVVGWRLESVDDDGPCFESLNERLSEGYSSWPTSELNSILQEVYPDTLSDDETKVRADIRLPGDIVARVWVNVSAPILG